MGVLGREIWGTVLARYARACAQGVATQRVYGGDDFSTTNLRACHDTSVDADRLSRRDNNKKQKNNYAENATANKKKHATKRRSGTTPYIRPFGQILSGGRLPSQATVANAYTIRLLSAPLPNRTRPTVHPVPPTITSICMMRMQTTCTSTLTVLGTHIDRIVYCIVHAERGIPRVSVHLPSKKLPSSDGMNAPKTELTLNSSVQPASV